jgi:hypothetical protein
MVLTIFVIHKEHLYKSTLYKKDGNKIVGTKMEPLSYLEKKRKGEEGEIMRRVSFAILMVVLIFVAAGIASATTFRHTVNVSGDGIVAVHKRVCVDNLTTQFSHHGCGDYSIDQVLDSSSTAITLNENYAVMNYKPKMLQAGISIPGEGLKFKDDLCIKNREVGAAMTVQYTYADSITKETMSRVSYTPLAELDIQSRVTGTAYIGVLLKDPDDPHETQVHVSEDYMGTFNLLRWLEIKDIKKSASSGSDETDEDWLLCPSNGTYPETGWEWCPTSSP